MSYSSSFLVVFLICFLEFNDSCHPTTNIKKATSSATTSATPSATYSVRIIKPNTTANCYNTISFCPSSANSVFCDDSNDIGYKYVKGDTQVQIVYECPKGKNAMLEYTIKNVPAPDLSTNIGAICYLSNTTWYTLQGDLVKDAIFTSVACR